MSKIIEEDIDDIVDLSQYSRRKILWILFFNFLKIATFVVGGGYAIILAAERIFVDKLRWLKKSELIDMLALSQTIPGLMAGNVAIYVGCRTAGKMGAFVALCGVALPSFVIICIVSYGYAKIPLDNSHLQGAFIGVRAALGGLTLATVIKMWKDNVKISLDYILMGLCFIGTIFFKINPAWLLLGAIIVGLTKIYIIEKYIRSKKNVSN